MTAAEFLTFVLYFCIFLTVLYFALKYWEKFKNTWLSMVRAEFYSKQTYSLLEITIPRGQTKTPFAMEVFLNSLYQGGGEGGWQDKWIKGSTKSWFSLELVSMEGKVNFFIWTKSSFASGIQTQLYAQFPEIGIKEMYQGDYKNDYVHKFTYDLAQYKFWCGEFVKKSDGHLPIKTYVDYGLDANAKEEFKIDPITPVLEYLGSLGSNEYAWIQMGIRVPGKDKAKPVPSDPAEAAKFRKEHKLKWHQGEAMVDWTDAAKEEVKKITSAEGKMTLQQSEKLKAVERGLTKLAYDTSIRAIYFAKKDNFSPANSAGLMGVFRQYNTVHLNSFDIKSPKVNYAWMDKNGVKVEGDKKKIFEQYKARAFFYPQFIPVGTGKWKSNKYSSKPFIMTVEELATLFHFPGDTNKTSTVSRVEAKKVEAPANLPI